jgi:hypothetical protein
MNESKAAADRLRGGFFVSPVIASEAKQSRGNARSIRGSWIASSPFGLLAMTGRAAMDYAIRKMR